MCHRRWVRLGRSPTTYPKDAARATIPHAICQPIGQRAYEEVSRASLSQRRTGNRASDEELAFFSRARKRLRAAERWAFDDWYGRRRRPAGMIP